MPLVGYIIRVFQSTSSVVVVVDVLPLLFRRSARGLVMLYTGVLSSSDSVCSEFNSGTNCATLSRSRSNKLSKFSFGMYSTNWLSVAVWKETIKLG